MRHILVSQHWTPCLSKQSHVSDIQRFPPNMADSGALGNCHSCWGLAPWYSSTTSSNHTSWNSLIWFAIHAWGVLHLQSNETHLFVRILFCLATGRSGLVMALDSLYSRSSASVTPEGPISSSKSHSMLKSLARSSFLWGSTFSMNSRTSWSLVKLYLKPILNKATPTRFAWWVNVWQEFVFGRHLDTKSWSFMVESHLKQVERIISASPSSKLSDVSLATVLYKHFLTASWNVFSGNARHVFARRNCSAGGVAPWELWAVAPLFLGHALKFKYLLALLQIAFIICDHAGSGLCQVRILCLILW